MSVHHLTADQIGARPRTEVFDFFSRPENLGRLTPPNMRFELLSEDRPAMALKLAAWPLGLLPSPPLTRDAVDFINQPATVDTGPLLSRMPRRLTPLAEGLGHLPRPGGTAAEDPVSGSFGVVTDGSCVLPRGELEALDVRVAPLHVRFGSESYASGPSGDLPHERFYELLERSADHPTTSQPSPGEWLALFDAERARGRRELLVITIASTMSGTFAGAQVAAASAGAALAVIDSRTNSGGQGLIVRAVARARQRGCSFEEAVALATRLAGRPVIFAYVDELAFLRRSGRVAALPAAFGTLLSIKPIVRIADGRTELVGRVRTRRRALERVEQLARAAAAERTAARIAVVHTNRPALAAEIASRARGWSDDAEVFCAEAGPVLATHVGPGVVAIAVLAGDQ